MKNAMNAAPTWAADGNGLWMVLGRVARRWCQGFADALGWRARVREGRPDAKGQASVALTDRAGRGSGDRPQESGSRALGENESSALKNSLPSLTTLVARTVYGFRATLPQNIGIKVKIEPKLWTTDTDVLPEVKQILSQWLRDGTRAMPTGGMLFLMAGNVKLGAVGGLEPSAKPGRYVRFSVTHTGMVVTPASAVEHGSSRLATTASGTGLGMGRGNERIESARGFMTCRAAGKGTQFNLYIPAKEQANME